MVYFGGVYPVDYPGNDQDTNGEHQNSPNY